MEYAVCNGILLSGGLFVGYHNVDLENLDIEMGFPVAKPILGNEVIKGYTIPARKVVSGIFLGTYEDTDQLMYEIMQWIEEHGYEQQGVIYNYYLNDDNRKRKQCEHMQTCCKNASAHANLISMLIRYGDLIFLSINTPRISTGYQPIVFVFWEKAILWRKTEMITYEHREKD